MSDQSIKALEAKIDELIAFASYLQEENARLSQRETALHEENSLLIEKNHATKSRIEGMVARLKSIQGE